MKTRGHVLPYEEWMDHGACRGQDPLLFFPENGNNHIRALAKAICGVCIHQQTCLDYAIDHEIEDGVWGGLAGRERRQIFRRRRALAVLAPDPLGPPESAHG